MPAPSRIPAWCAWATGRVKQVLGMRLTWNKRYITLAPIATVLGLAFKLSDPDRFAGRREKSWVSPAR
ncbi:hypothetical protein LN650_26415 [Klebsiella pneumoniae subsp. pneumoniae]|nr:hypothetical protein [Klebsiella pneumoniae subsp. pneumoniae]